MPKASRSKASIRHSTHDRLTSAFLCFRGSIRVLKGIWGWLGAPSQPSVPLNQWFTVRLLTVTAVKWTDRIGNEKRACVDRPAHQKRTTTRTKKLVMLATRWLNANRNESFMAGPLGHSTVLPMTFQRGPKYRARVRRSGTTSVEGSCGASYQALGRLSRIHEQPSVSALRKWRRERDQFYR
jgi:hypothetical protein